MLCNQYNSPITFRDFSPKNIYKLDYILNHNSIRLSSDSASESFIIIEDNKI